MQWVNTKAIVHPLPLGVYHEEVRVSQQKAIHTALLLASSKRCSCRPTLSEMASLITYVHKRALINDKKLHSSKISLL